MDDDVRQAGRLALFAPLAFVFHAPARTFGKVAPVSAWGETVRLSQKDGEGWAAPFIHEIRHGWERKF